jgi:CheY-like chemotaxis protein
MARILIIDDDPMVTKLLQEHLSNEGHTVVSTAFGKQGLDIAFKSPPDLILLDVNLPDSTGFQVIGKLRENTSTKTVPTIMMSGAARFPNQQKIGLEMGANEYILKPFDIISVGERIDKLLGVQNKPKPATPAEVPPETPAASVPEEAPAPLMEEPPEQTPAAEPEVPAAPVEEPAPPMSVSEPIAAPPIPKETVVEPPPLPVMPPIESLIDVPPHKDKRVPLKESPEWIPTPISPPPQEPPPSQEHQSIPPLLETPSPYDTPPEDASVIEEPVRKKKGASPALTNDPALAFVSRPAAGTTIAWIMLGLHLVVGLASVILLHTSGIVQSVTFVAGGWALLLGIVVAVSASLQIGLDPKTALSIVGWGAIPIVLRSVVLLAAGFVPGLVQIRAALDAVRLPAPLFWLRPLDIFEMVSIVILGILLRRPRGGSIAKSLIACMAIALAWSLTSRGYFRPF